MSLFRPNSSENNTYLRYRHKVQKSLTLLLLYNHPRRYYQRHRCHQCRYSYQHHHRCHPQHCQCRHHQRCQCRHYQHCQCRHHQRCQCRHYQRCLCLHFLRRQIQPLQNQRRRLQRCHHPSGCLYYHHCSLQLHRTQDLASLVAVLKEHEILEEKKTRTVGPL